MLVTLRSGSCDDDAKKEEVEQHELHAHFQEFPEEPPPLRAGFDKQCDKAAGCTEEVVGLDHEHEYPDSPNDDEDDSRACRDRQADQQLLNDDYVNGHEFYDHVAEGLSPSFHRCLPTNFVPHYRFS